MDYDEAGPLGLQGRPPANDDGTSNEVLTDQFIRLRQFLSLQESRTSGEIILVIFPDGTGPALLSCMIAGIPFNEVHALDFEPGEIRLDVNREKILDLWKERREDPTYLAKLQDGREKIASLRRDNGGSSTVNTNGYTSPDNGKFVSKLDEKMEAERLEIDQATEQRLLASRRAEEVLRQNRADAEAERRRAYEQRMRLRQEQKAEKARLAAESKKAQVKAKSTEVDQQSFLGTVGLAGGATLGVVALRLMSLDGKKDYDKKPPLATVVTGMDRPTMNFATTKPLER